jgi:hypothetical protein
MNPVNLFMALDLLTELTQRVMAYSALIQKARSENRDLTDDELTSISTQAGLALELAHKRIAALKQ